MAGFRPAGVTLAVAGVIFDGLSQTDVWFQAFGAASVATKALPVRMATPRSTVLQDRYDEIVASEITMPLPMVRATPWPSSAASWFRASANASRRSCACRCT